MPWNYFLQHFFPTSPLIDPILILLLALLTCASRGQKIPEIMGEMEILKSHLGWNFGFNFKQKLIENWLDCTCV